MLFSLQVMLRQCLDSSLLPASSGVAALGTRDIVFLCRQLLSSIAPFSPLSVPVFDLHGAVFRCQTLVAFTSLERFSLFCRR